MTRMSEDYHLHLLELKKENLNALLQIQQCLSSTTASLGDLTFRHFCIHCQCIDDGSDDEDHHCQERSRLDSSSILVGKSRRKKRPRKRPLTVVKPFSMTLREEKNKENISSQLVDSLIDLPLEKSDNGLEESVCQYHFKAKPIPKHVKERLFQNLIMTQPKRFPPSQWLKVRSRSLSATDLKPMKAKPFPAHIFSNEAYDRMEELKKFREIKKQERMKNLLKCAKTPSNMLDGPRTKENPSHQNETKSAFKRTRRSNSMPNFEEIHARWNQELLNKKQEKVTTVVIPFSFDRFSNDKVSGKSKDRTAADDEICTHKPDIKKSRANLDNPPEESRRITRTSELRKRHNLQIVKRYRKQEEEFNAKLMRRELKWLDQRGQISQQMQTRDSGRFKSFHLETKLQMLMYKANLDDMYDRVRQGPSLIERQAQINTMRAAKKKISDVLSSQGLDTLQI